MVTVASLLSRSESKQQDALRPRSEPVTGILKMWQPFPPRYIRGKHDRVIAAIVIADNSLRVSLLFTVTAAAT